MIKRVAACVILIPHLKQSSDFSEAKWNLPPLTFQSPVLTASDSRSHAAAISSNAADSASEEELLLDDDSDDISEVLVCKAARSNCDPGVKSPSSSPHAVALSRVGSVASSSLNSSDMISVSSSRRSDSQHASSS